MPDTATAVCSGDPSAACRRTDARSITTTYAYDVLNRLTSKNYSDGVTPAALFGYDETRVTIGYLNYPVSNGIGRLSWTYTGNYPVFVQNSYSYDAMGRVRDYYQCTPYNCHSTGNPAIWQTHYDYDLGGEVKDWTHPAGFTLTNTINAA